MASRREFIRAAAAFSVTPACSSWASSRGVGAARLQTRLFNFRDEVSPEKAEAIMVAFKRAARAAGATGLLVGRNLVPTPFPTRFEWIYMVEMVGSERTSPTTNDELLQSMITRLEAMCRDQVLCDLACPLPADFADAPGVGVRHTVMFSFKPDAPANVRSRIVADIRQMGTLPMVRGYLVAPGLPQLTGDDAMEWQVIGDFATIDDYRAYSEAPAHQAIRHDFTTNTSRVAFLDVRP